MKIDILTLFPEMFTGPLDMSIVKRAKAKGLVEINVHNLRGWSEDTRGTVDDRPYSGGPGMVLRVDVIDRALTELKTDDTRIILLDARGEKFNQRKAKTLSKLSHIILIAGHYEGIDHRVHDYLIHETISIGDYVLTGGELPAMVIADAITRLVPEVIDPESLKEESHTEEGYLEPPQYTRPEEYKGWKVPEVLLSGDPKKINEWKKDKTS